MTWKMIYERKSILKKRQSYRQLSSFIIKAIHLIQLSVRYWLVFRLFDEERFRLTLTVQSFMEIFHTFIKNLSPIFTRKRLSKESSVINFESKQTFFNLKNAYFQAVIMQVWLVSCNALTRFRVIYQRNERCYNCKTLK